MAPTKEELLARLQLSTDEVTKYSAVLEQVLVGATTIIDTYCHRSFSGVSTTTEKRDLKINQVVVVLKNAPIVSVESLTVSGENVPYFLYEQEGIVKLKEPAKGGLQAFEIKYKYGYMSFPGALKEVALALASAMFNRLPSAGISSESIGDYKVNFDDWIFHLRFSTEWSLYKEVLDTYKLER